MLRTERLYSGPTGVKPSPRRAEVFAPPRFSPHRGFQLTEVFTLARLSNDLAEAFDGQFIQAVDSQICVLQQID
jgi:hypothetical protein